MANETKNFKSMSYTEYVMGEIGNARNNVKLGNTTQKKYEEMLSSLNGKMEQLKNLSERIKDADGEEKNAIASQMKRLIEEIMKLIKQIMEMLMLHTKSERGSLFGNVVVQNMNNKFEVTLGNLINVTDGMEQKLLGDMKQELLDGQNEMASMMVELVAKVKTLKDGLENEQNSIKNMFDAEKQSLKELEIAAAKKAALDEAEPIVRNALKESGLDRPDVHFYRLKNGDYLAVDPLATKQPEGRLPGQNTETPLFVVFDAATGRIDNAGYTEQEFVSTLQGGIMDGNGELLQVVKDNDAIRKLMELQEEYTNSRFTINILEFVRSGFLMQDGIDATTKEEVSALWKNINQTIERELSLGFIKNSLPIENLRHDTERLAQLIATNAKSDTDKTLAGMIEKMPDFCLSVEEKYRSFASENRDAFATAMENIVNNMDKSVERLMDFDAVCAEIRQNHETVINRCEEEAKAIAERLSVKEASVGVLKKDYEQLVDRVFVLHKQANSSDLTNEKSNELMSEIEDALHETAKIQAQLRCESRKYMPPKEYLEQRAEHLRQIVSKETEVEVNSDFGYINVAMNGGDRTLQYYYEGCALSAIKLNDSLLCAFDTKRSEDGLFRDFSYIDKSNAELLNVILEGALQKDGERTGGKFTEEQDGQMKTDKSGGELFEEQSGREEDR